VKRKIAKNTSVYVVTSIDDCDDGSDSLVAGAYASRGRALDEAVQYIMERLGMRADIRRCMMNDENHPEARKFFREDDLGYAFVRKNTERRFRRFLRDEIGGQGCYIAVSGNDMFRFDLDEVGLEGPVTLHTVVEVVTGTDDNAPEPCTFSSNAAAYDYIRREISDYWRDLHEGTDIDRKRLNGFVAAVRDFGSVQIPIRGDVELHFSVWTHELDGD